MTMSKKNTYYYATDGNHLVRFSSFDRLSIFLENMPDYRIVYRYEAMCYPQYELVSDDEWFADELVVDRRGYDVGFFNITYWGKWQGFHRWSHPHRLTREEDQTDWEEIAREIYSE